MGQSTPISGKTILIVEDEALIRFDLVDFFEAAGWRVLDAENADDAIAILDQHKEVRAVLTDVQMPGSMDGLKLAHYVRNRFPPTVLFVVSGNLRIPENELPLRTTFLSKPFDQNSLLKQLEAKVGQSIALSRIPPLIGKVVTSQRAIGAYAFCSAIDLRRPAGIVRPTRQAMVIGLSVLRSRLVCCWATVAFDLRDEAKQEGACARKADPRCSDNTR